MNVASTSFTKQFGVLMAIYGPPFPTRWTTSGEAHVAQNPLLRDPSQWADLKSEAVGQGVSEESA